MIRYRNEVFWDYFIHPQTGMITDEFGNVVEQHFAGDRMYVNIHGRGRRVHQIQAHTAWGYKEGCDVHHRDGNPLNNDLYNLEYITHGAHSSITLSKANIGRVPWMKGKNHTSEAKLKNRLAHLGKTSYNSGKLWWTNGIKNIYASLCPGDDWWHGMTKINSKKGLKP